MLSQIVSIIYSNLSIEAINAKIQFPPNQPATNIRKFEFFRWLGKKHPFKVSFPTFSLYNGCWVVDCYWMVLGGGVQLSQIHFPSISQFSFSFSRSFQISCQFLFDLCKFKYTAESTLYSLILLLSDVSFGLTCPFPSVALRGATSIQGDINCGPSSHPDFIKNYFLFMRMLEFFDRRDKYRKSGLEAPPMGGISHPTSISQPDPSTHI